MATEKIYGKVPSDIYIDYTIALYLAKLPNKTFEQKEMMFNALDAFFLTAKNYISAEYGIAVSEMCDTLRQYL